MAASTCIEAALAGLDVQKLALVRGERLVVRDVDFHVAAGEALAISGPNGAGKTSILRALAGLLEPQSGSVVLRLAGGNVVASGEERGRFAAWMGHQDAIKPQLTSREHLSFHLQFQRAKGDIDAALRIVGLARLCDLPAQYLSAGQRRRLALARLVVAPRPLWVLDEPLSTLDPQGRGLVGQLITQHCATGGIVVAATHEPLGVRATMLDLG